MDRVAATCVINTSWVTKSAESDATRLVGLWWQYVKYEINVLMWVALFIVTWVLMKRLWSLGMLWLKASRLPGPPISHFARHAKFGNYTEYFRALHKEYGPIVRVWLGPTRALVSLNSKSMARELVVRARDRDLRTCRTMERAFGRGSMSAACYAQVKVKRFPIYDKFGGKLLDSVQPAAVRGAAQLRRWVQLGDDGLKFNRKQVSDHMCFASVGLIYFGEAYVHWPGAEEFEVLMAEISAETHLWGKFNLVPLWNKEFREYKKKCVRLQALAKEIIHLSRQWKATLNEHQNGLLCYLEEVDAFVSNGGGREVVHDIIRDLLSGGAATSSTAMSEDEVRGHLLAIICHTWTATATIMSDLLLRLARYPGVQAKVHAEIDRVCKGGGPTSADVRQMHYFRAVLYESTRLDPCAPLLTRCSLDCDLKIADSILPAGAILSIPIQALQTDTEECGQDAYEFHPERFLKQSYVESNSNAFAISQENPSLKSGSLSHQSAEQSGDNANDNICPVFQHPGSSSIYLSYGSGARRCPGQDVTTGLTLTIVSSILQQYEVQPEAKAEELTPSSILVLVPRH